MITLVLKLLYYLLIWPFVVMVRLCLLPFRLMLWIALLPFRALDWLIGLPGRLLSPGRRRRARDDGDTMDSFLDFVEAYESLTED